MQLFEALTQSKAQQVKADFTSQTDALAKAVDEAKQILTDVQQKKIDKATAQEFLKRYQI